MAICLYNLIKFAQYVGVVPMKYEKIVMYHLNGLFLNYICFPDRCVSFAVRCISHFGFESGTLVEIASDPGHCLYFTFYCIYFPF